MFCNVFLLHKYFEYIVMKLIMSDRHLNINVNLGHDYKYFDLSTMKIANCMGCFGCWTKTPGRCVIRDDATRVYPYIAASNMLLYVSRLKYGGYDTVMKTMLERAIPIQQAFIRIYHNETHHVQRAVLLKKATIIAYGDVDEEERDIFRQLVARNACNMNFESYEIVFELESVVDNAVKQILEKWEKL